MGGARGPVGARHHRLPLPALQRVWRSSRHTPGTRSRPTRGADGEPVAGATKVPLECHLSSPFQPSSATLDHAHATGVTSRQSSGESDSREVGSSAVGSTPTRLRQQSSEPSSKARLTESPNVHPSQRENGHQITGVQTGGKSPVQLPPIPDAARGRRKEGRPRPHRTPGGGCLSGPTLGGTEGRGLGPGWWEGKEAAKKGKGGEGKWSDSSR